ncbi:DUF2949 domain-containing protein [Candidatus Cyanaurora vandensis]|uniref:DUF2949 domain-containing protein n=1 Tax=Candidatus Cyanaurora vandensis TaxID=2714958 RepID=UPI00257AAD8E|nr:DUF2949 domain-containing protein [Candidatus Cyanaurora vandensis]
MFTIEQVKAEFILAQGLVGTKELELALRVQRINSGPLEIILWRLGLWSIQQLDSFYGLLDWTLETP